MNDERPNDDALRAMEALLQALGLSSEEDPQLRDTPARFVELLRDRFLPVERTMLRALPAEQSICGPILIRDIPFHAMCAHHVVPFFGHVNIAYMPHEHLAGFGAFPRLVQELSRGPQLQERLAASIADAIHHDLQAVGVLVSIEARQMCMELTGTCGQSNTVVIAARGYYDSPDAHARASELFGTRRA